MIARVQGVLDTVSSGSVHLVIGEGLVYDVLVPAFVAARLNHQMGDTIVLHTLYYFESQNQGATILPRLAGFLTSDDRAFFELFTTCKGIGYRKALRAMKLPTNQIANAIADRDIALLQSLPEIGRRTAETIIATLRGKVDSFVTPDGVSAPDANDPGTSSQTAAPGIARDALEVLLQLGENRAQAAAWIDGALGDADEQPANVEALISRVYRLKAGA